MKNPVKKIYVDLDGVICDFHGRYNELYHSTAEEDYPEVSNNEKKRQFLKHWNDFVSGGNFATLDPMPDWEEGFKFLKLIEDKTDIKVYVLSSTARAELYESVGTDKITWLRNNNVPFEPILVPGKRYKKIYASPESVLIDDTEKNIMDWNEAEGTPILHENWETTINSIKTLLSTRNNFPPSALEEK